MGLGFGERTRQRKTVKIMAKAKAQIMKTFSTEFRKFFSLGGGIPLVELSLADEPVEEPCFLKESSKVVEQGQSRKGEWMDFLKTWSEGVSTAMGKSWEDLVSLDLEGVETWPLYRSEAKTGEGAWQFSATGSRGVSFCPQF